MSIQHFSAMLLIAVSSVVCYGSEPRVASSDWPAWRGPNGDGIADSQQQPPLEWSETKNVLWKVAVPGRGYSSPTVTGDKLFLATAEEEEGLQSVLCFDRNSGQQLWKSVVHTGGLETKGHPKSTQASASVACDGERLFINFLNDRVIYTTALDLDGKQLWQTKVSDFETHQGFGASPILYKELVLVATDNRAGGVIAGLNRATGDIVWQHQRPKEPNYTSPAVFRLFDKDQLIMQGCDKVSSLDPATGEELWEIEGSTTECVTQVVTDGERVFVSGGYPRRHVQAVLADGSGTTVWENNSQVYVPSMIVRDGYLYAMQDNGVATCWKAATGEEVWKGRVGGNFTASLVLVGDLLFAMSEGAECVVFKANPEKFELVARNQLENEAFATPTICGGRIYARVIEQRDGNRQEWLYCLGEK